MKVKVGGTLKVRPTFPIKNSVIIKIVKDLKEGQLTAIAHRKPSFSLNLS